MSAKYFKPSSIFHKSQNMQGKNFKSVPINFEIL